MCEPMNYKTPQDMLDAFKRGIKFEVASAMDASGTDAARVIRMEKSTMDGGQLSGLDVYQEYSHIPWVMVTPAGGIPGCMYTYVRHAIASPKTLSNPKELDAQNAARYRELRKSESLQVYQVCPDGLAGVRLSKEQLDEELDHSISATKTIAAGA